VLSGMARAIVAQPKRGGQGWWGDSGMGLDQVVAMRSAWVPPHISARATV
jgi:hypothetical protein